MMAAHLQEVPKPPIVLRPGHSADAESNYRHGSRQRSRAAISIRRRFPRRFEECSRARRSHSGWGRSASFRSFRERRQRYGALSRNAGLAISNHRDGHPRLPTNATRWGARALLRPRHPLALCHKRHLLRQRQQSSRPVHRAWSFHRRRRSLRRRAVSPEPHQNTRWRWQVCPASAASFLVSYQVRRPSPASADAMTPSTPRPLDGSQRADLRRGGHAPPAAQAVQSGQSSPDSSNAASTTSTDVVPATSAASNSGGASAQPAKKPSPAKSKKDSQAARRGRPG